MKEIIEGLNLPKQILDKAEKFMATLFGPSAKEISELFADKIRYQRLKNQIKIFNKTIELLDKNNIEARELNLKTLVPLIEKSSLEDNELLQNKWAILLANITSSPETGLEPKLVKTLSNLSTLEAQVLDYCFDRYKLERERIYQDSKKYKWIHYETINDVKPDRVLIKFNWVKENFKLDDSFAKICIDNLNALGLVRYEEPVIEIETGNSKSELKNDEENGEYVDLNLDVSANYSQSDDFNLLTYGLYFIEQCNAK
jgi:hypothetical protein